MALIELDRVSKTYSSGELTVYALHPVSHYLDDVMETACGLFPLNPSSKATEFSEKSRFIPNNHG